MGIQVFTSNAPSPPAYTVFTALLTQSGGDDPQFLVNVDNGNIVPGVTYVISDYQIGDDFTNVGAPSNANGVSFIATGTTAINWAGTSELIYNNGAPVCTVLENTLGNVWFEYIQDGLYSFNSIGLFIQNKCFYQNSLFSSEDGTFLTMLIIKESFQFQNQFLIGSTNFPDFPVNDILQNSSF